jgi:hypothetical protein
VTQLPVEYVVHTTGLQKFAADLRKANPQLRKEFDRLLKKGGEGIVAEAKVNADWSSRIPGSIRLGVNTGRVQVKAGNSKAPHAAAFEHGGRDGTFRHPVYGHKDVWVDQEAHPFLGPEIPKHTAEIEKGLLNAWDHIHI